MLEEANRAIERKMSNVQVKVSEPQITGLFGQKAMMLTENQEGGAGLMEPLSTQNVGLLEPSENKKKQAINVSQHSVYSGFSNSSFLSMMKSPLRQAGLHNMSIFGKSTTPGTYRAKSKGVKKFGTPESLVESIKEEKEEEQKEAEMMNSSQGQGSSVNDQNSFEMQKHKLLTRSMLFSSIHGIGLRRPQTVLQKPDSASK